MKWQLKWQSFRLRVALLSAMLAGTALVGFAAVSWFQIYNAKISRLDAELVNQLLRAPRLRESDRVREPERWDLYGSTLAYAFGANTKTPIALLVLDGSGNTLYQTSALPADQNINSQLVQRLKLAPPPPSPRMQPPPLPPRSDGSNKPPRPGPPRPQFVTERTTTGNWRIGAANFPDLSVAIAVNLQTINQEMGTIRNIFLISIPGVLLLVAGGAWLIAGSALRPIHQLTDVIQQVTVKGLDQRIPMGTIDSEFVELIQVFNQMLERLERSFTQASRFSADAAHELKTPLTILQGELERSLQQVPPGSEVQQRLSNLLDEVRRLSSIMRKLLLLSLADAGQMSLHTVAVDISILLDEMLEDLELLAPHLTVQTDVPKGLWVRGDRDLLVQVLQNLLSNAIKYNLPAGWIALAAKRQGKTVTITISNASQEIPLRDRERLFDRFHRGDPARTRKVEGIGLGLSLAREIVRAHGGSLTLDATTAGQTAFTLTLPTALAPSRSAAGVL
ncbi:MAG: ATP-binding protein [Leptolyngbya sp. BL-A-14]